MRWSTTRHIIIATSITWTTRWFSWNHIMNVVSESQWVDCWIGFITWSPWISRWFGWNSVWIFSRSPCTRKREPNLVMLIGFFFQFQCVWISHRIHANIAFPLSWNKPVFFGIFICYDSTYPTPPGLRVGRCAGGYVSSVLSVDGSSFSPPDGAFGGPQTGGRRVGFPSGIGQLLSAGVGGVGGMGGTSSSSRLQLTSSLSWHLLLISSNNWSDGQWKVRRWPFTHLKYWRQLFGSAKYGRPYCRHELQLTRCPKSHNCFSSLNRYLSGHFSSLTTASFAHK